MIFQAPDEDDAFFFQNFCTAKRVAVFSPLRAEIMQVFHNRPRRLQLDVILLYEGVEQVGGRNGLVNHNGLGGTVGAEDLHEQALRRI